MYTCDLYLSMLCQWWTYALTQHSDRMTWQLGCPFNISPRFIFQKCLTACIIVLTEKNWLTVLSANICKQCPTICTREYCRLCTLMGRLWTSLWVCHISAKVKVQLETTHAREPKNSLQSACTTINHAAMFASIISTLKASHYNPMKPTRPYIS